MTPTTVAGGTTGRRHFDWGALYRPGKTAFLSYWKLIVGIQLCAVTVVALYYTWPDFQTGCNWLADFKVRGGLLFTAIGTLISGGVIPEVLKWKFRPAHLPKPTWGEIIHQCAIFPICGIIVDYFYKLQAVLFGTGTDVGTVALKILVDQLFFGPLVGIPIIITWFLFRELHYNPWRTLRQWSVAFYVERGLPMYATALTYWPIMLVFIYALPSALQFPLFLFANTAWSLIMVFIARRQVEAHKAVLLAQ
ncbi:MAG: hypothetical protein SFY80_13600 [Verrucomicrobiota bacterium]|nr:hypothetical protein [Verrucomicrobiota bacterium]